MRTCGTLLWFASVMLLCGQSSSTKLPDFSVPKGMVSRDFPLGYADLGMVEKLCQETLSAEGKYHLFQAARKVRVIDRPAEVEAIRQMLGHLSAPPQMVRIDFTSLTSGRDSLRGFQVRGQGQSRVGGVVVGGQVGGTPGVFRRQIGGGDRGDLSQPVTPSTGRVVINGGSGGGVVDVDLVNQNSANTGVNTQFIVVRSGGEGFIEVARDIPMIDYFTRFVADGSFGAILGNRPQIVGNNQLIPLVGGRFEVPEIRWEKAGSRLLVRPVVEGNLIHLTLMPQISAVVIVDPAAFRARSLNSFLTGREQYVTYTALATEVTIQNGQSLPVGGFAKASDTFNRYLFGAVRSEGSSVGSLTVKATIQ
ncbi:MAG: hypothetical protein AAGJ31_10105 [Verrucomicrobiota bacterium]